jgi:hypothetical protein
VTATTKPGLLGQIAASATRAERTATVCVAGHLNSRYDELEVDLQRSVEQAKGGSLADGKEQRRLAEDMQAVREQMREHEHTFTFRAMAPKDWSDLQAEHPGRDGKQELFNVDTFPLAAATASLVKIDGQEQDQVDAEAMSALWSVLNAGQRNELFGAAWEANTGRVSVPFSRLVSAILGSTEKK